jgi:ubiquinone/menaquinone biosynthesis C-methylase UbiE
MSSNNSPKRVPAEVYDQSYYLNSMEGADEFIDSGGQKLSYRLEFSINLAKITPGERVLDIGCGRGEAALNCALRGAKAHGLDYSSAAMHIARQLMDYARRNDMDMSLEQALADQLPFADNSFDKVFMLDIVEHLHQPDLERTFVEVYRILKPGANLVIHTMPNADYYRWGYPMYRSVMALFGQKLPRDPRSRWYRGDTHVNIQNPRRLRQALIESGFSQVHVWIDTLTDRSLIRTLLSIGPWRWVLLNDILGIAVKP